MTKTPEIGDSSVVQQFLIKCGLPLPRREMPSPTVGAMITSHDNPILAPVSPDLRRTRTFAPSAQSKIEIGALGVDELRETRIPAADEELGAIIKATENATNIIMGCAQVVTSAATCDTAAFRTLVQEKMLVIFEACSFQDITGQRIAKVIETLEHIEMRVARFAAAVHAKDLGGYLTEVEQARAERRKRLLLNGPACEGEGIAQTEVDRLLR